jgi:NAD(P)-dependent dehydrogenase (short-subunit alcohol dehydrogenase family)
MAQNNTFDLDGKIALVTGASRGIGAAAAGILAAHGAHVILSSRKEGACEEVAEAIRAKGGKASALACHIGEMDDITAAFESIEKTHGRLDILVNNAATNPYFGPIVDTDPGAFQKTVDVNIRGYFFMCALGAKLMAKNGGGSIINVASVNGAIPAAMQGIVREGVRAAGRAGQRHIAGSDRYEVRRRSRPEPGHTQNGPSAYSDEPGGAAGRDRRCDPLSGLSCCQLHHRRGDQCRRRLSNGLTWLWNIAGDGRGVCVRRHLHSMS